MSMEVEKLYLLAIEKEKSASTIKEAKKLYQEIIDNYECSHYSYKASHALDRIEKNHAKLRNGKSAKHRQDQVEATAGLDYINESVAFICARHLTKFAFLIWLASLFFNGFTLYNQDQLLGFNILIMGWLSPLVFNFAWFANIFFLYGSIRLISGGAPIQSPVYAVILSFDTFRIAEGLLNEGGSTSPIYGYGWGAVLWLLSIFLFLAASGIRQREINEKMHDWYQTLGFSLFFIALGSVSFFTIHDRIVANSAESQRLTNVAFKRGEICRKPEPMAVSPIHNLSGPLEIIEDKNEFSSIYPFKQTERLLAWGISTVRIGNADYSYEPPSLKVVFSSVPATGTSAAILHLSKNDLRSITAKLVETSSNRTVFEQVWKREDLDINSNYYCPDYHPFPSVDEQPRKIIMQSLNLDATNNKHHVVDQQKGVIDKIEGVIVGRAGGGETTKMKSDQWMKEHSKDKPFHLSHERFNTNCPKDIGWDGDSNVFMNTSGWPFLVGSKAYYLKHRKSYYSTCEGGFAYIYSGSTRDGKYSLYIEKRDLVNFRQAWEKVIVIPEVSPSIRNNGLEVKSIKIATNGVIIELVNVISGEILFIQTSING